MAVISRSALRKKPGNLAALLADAAIDFGKEVVADAVDVLHELTAMFLLGSAELVVEGSDVVGLLEDAQVWQCAQIVDAQLGGHHSLVIDADEEHEVFHAAHFCFLFFLASAEKFAEYRHDLDLLFNDLLFAI